MSRDYLWFYRLVGSYRKHWDEPTKKGTFRWFTTRWWHFQENGRLRSTHTARRMLILLLTIQATNTGVKQVVKTKPKKHRHHFVWKDFNRVGKMKTFGGLCVCVCNQVGDHIAFKSRIRLTVWSNHRDLWCIRSYKKHHCDGKTWNDRENKWKTTTTVQTNHWKLDLNGKTIAVLSKSCNKNSI